MGYVKEKSTRILRAITSQYPLNTPRASVLKRLPPVPADYGEFTGKSGAKYRAYWPGNDEVCSSLFWFGDHDPWVCHTLSRLIRPGSVVIDIGANIGSTAISMAMATGPRGKVICFEPMPPNIGYLKENVAANSLSWVEIEPIALSNADGILPMALPHDHAGRARVNADCPDFMVSAMTLDQWLSDRGPLDISACKIDVEGHEERVFLGMTKTLVSQVIPAIVFEHHGAITKDDPIITLLVGCGYRVLRIEKGMFNVFCVDISSSPKAARTSDFLAISPAVN